MTDMRDTIIPKSDQLNADDLIGGRTLTITVTGVDIKMDEQPVAIHFEGDGGKPYKPGKSMRRVLVNVWGPDANAYVGRSMTLYRDETVKFGGLEVGGIRISHMSHMQKPTTMALTATKAQRKPFTVRPLEAAAPPEPRRTVKEWLAATGRDLDGAADLAEVEAIVTREEVQKALRTLTNGALETLREAIQRARAAMTPIAESDGWPGPDVPAASDAEGGA